MSCGTGGCGSRQSTTRPFRRTKFVSAPASPRTIPAPISTRRSTFFPTRWSRRKCRRLPLEVEAMSNSQIVKGMKPRYVSNKNESVRFFDNAFIEFFSHVHPATPLVIFLPVIGFLLYLALGQRGLSIGATAGLFALGLLIWTLVEYAMHRYLFHYEPKTRLGRRLHFLVHGAHHDYPQDASRLVAPPAFSVPVAAVFFLRFLGGLGRLGPGAFAG